SMLLARLLRVPTSRPFPYTTLFRSQDVQLGVAALQGLEDLERAVRRAVVHGDDLVAVPREGPRDLLDQERQIVSFVVHRDHERQDRKSTRLNSSHGSISYAVFCLKK